MLMSRLAAKMFLSQRRLPIPITLARRILGIRLEITSGWGHVANHVPGVRDVVADGIDWVAVRKYLKLPADTLEREFERAEHMLGDSGHVTSSLRRSYNPNLNVHVSVNQPQSTSMAGCGRR